MGRGPSLTPLPAISRGCWNKPLCNDVFYIEEKMSGISVEVNGTRIATISLAGREVVDVSVYGALDRHQKATLNAGGNHLVDDGYGHLIWITEQALLPGDVVRVSLDESCGIADQGKTIDELYPDEEPSTRTDFTIDENMAAEMRTRPRLHEAFAVQVETSSGQQATAASDDLNTDFSFSLLWDSSRPHQARVRLATYCLDDVLARTGGSTHLKTFLFVGDSASFVLAR
jgi:hypothetical protein